MVWDDDVTQWVARDLDGNEFAEIRQTWSASDVLNSWTIETSDYSAEMRLKWRDDPNLWEMNVEGSWITAQTMLNDRFDRWRLKMDGETYVLERRWPGMWELRDYKGQKWSTEIQYQGDLRDWIIESSLDVWPDGLELLMTMLAITNELEIR